MTLNQIHPWANYGDYETQPTLLEDCSYTGERLNMANWEIISRLSEKTSFPMPYTSTNDIFKEIQDVPSQLA